MKTHASESLPKIEIIGNVVRVHLNEVIIIKPDYTDYCYDTAVMKTTSTRSEIIEAIIASQYSFGEELSTINNQVLKPAEFTAYQAFRDAAKAVSAEVLLKVGALLQ